MKNRISYVILLLLLSPGICLQAQSYGAYKRAGDAAFAGKDYNAALHYYDGALRLKPTETALLFQYAESARLFHAYELAEATYQKVLKQAGAERHPEAQFYLGQMLQIQGEYVEAKAAYQAYLALDATSLTAEAQQQIVACDFAIDVLANPQPIRITHLNKRVNTQYSEFAPMPVGDTLFYTSYRYDKEKDKYQPARKISKVLYSNKGGRGRPLSYGFNEDTLLTAHTTFSLDGQRLYYTRCQYTEGIAIRCEIFYKERDRRKRWRGKPVKLPATINLPKYTATHPNISYDSLLQAEVLYFVSDRPGGQGGMDIWWTKVEDGRNKFGLVQNLSDLNTGQDEITPFLHRASQQLFFSSTGYPGLGAHDIFSAKRTNVNQWAAPEHLGYPLNSSYNDTYFVPADPAVESGYLSSNRTGSLYLDKANKSCCNDLYHFRTIPPEPESTDTTAIVRTTPDPIDPVTTVLPAAEPTIPNRLEDFLPLALYFDNDEPDRRTRRTTTKKNYTTTFERYYANKEEYLQAYAAPLSTEERPMAEAAMEDFFEDEVKRGNDFLIRFSEILLEKLQAGEQVEIFIKGYTSPRAQSDYNLALGQRRVSSLRNHFNTYQGGVFQPYLTSQQLKVTERSFGETTADTSVSDDLADLRNSVYSIDAAMERRVEIVEISREKE